MQPFPSVEHEDAFLLFRALCKLSQRPDHAGPGDGLAVAPTAEEARQMESKAVSLVGGAVSRHLKCIWVCVGFSSMRRVMIGGA